MIRFSQPSNLDPTISKVLGFFSFIPLSILVFLIPSFLRLLISFFFPPICSFPNSFLQSSFLSFVLKSFCLPFFLSLLLSIYQSFLFLPALFHLFIYPFILHISSSFLIVCFFLFFNSSFLAFLSSFLTLILSLNLFLM